MIPVIGAVLLSIDSPMASASIYSVDSTDYWKIETLTPFARADRYELNATSGVRIRYAVTADTAGSCVQLYFSQGHDLPPVFQYLVQYSQEDCVQSFTDDFTVSSDDGTEFTITISTTYDYDMNYTVNVNVSKGISDLIIPDWLCPLLALIVVLIVVMIAIVAVRSRRRNTAMMQAPPPTRQTWRPPPPPPPPP